MKTIVLIIALALPLAGCDRIFGTPDDDIANGLIAGKPFVVDQAAHPLPPCSPGTDKTGTVWTCSTLAFDRAQPVTVIPVGRQADMPCPSVACTQVLANRIYILQSPNVTGMLQLFFHEYGSKDVPGHGSGGRHAGDTQGLVHDERAELLEAERARALAR